MLHSTRAASPGITKYATHMAATADEHIQPVFFTWPRALFARYDIFHLHWPEGLVGTASGFKGSVSYVLTRMLVLRLRLSAIPVVHTLHNHTPHDSAVSDRLRRVNHAFERLIVEEIHLVPESGHHPRTASAYIPHGGYVEPFQEYPREAAVAGRAVFFGIMRPYKGIEELLDVFALNHSQDIALRLVGHPQDSNIRRAIERAGTTDQRVSYRFEFVSDRDLVTEVTAAQLIVLPYRELHSSGALLVALSLERPVLIPDGTTARALRDEVGAEWVSIYDPPLSASTLEAALLSSRIRPSSPPDLSARTWQRVRLAHRAVYQRAVAPIAGDEKVFAWLWGQADNLGDSALRRGYADALRQRGPLVVYVADAPASFVSGLGLRPGERTVRHLSDWLAEAVAAARRGPATLAINSGEFSLSGRYTLSLLRILPALRRFRRHGGRVVWLGAAVPATRRGVTWLFRRLYRSADLIRWRDSETAAVFAPASTMPDWALGLPSTATPRERDSVGVSLRFDRPYPSASWIAEVKSLADRFDLNVVTLAQVQRDSPYAERLAHDLGGRAVSFATGTPHDTHEGILRQEYSRMRIVISDRLHVLLIGQSEGAVPLGWTETATSKLDRHFRSLGLPWVTTSPAQCVESLRALDDKTLERFAADSLETLTIARAALTDVRAVLADGAWRRMRNV